MRHPLGFAALLGLVWLGCDSSNPVAPGTDDGLAPANQYTVTMKATSSSLFAFSPEECETNRSAIKTKGGEPTFDCSAGVTVTVTRNSDGGPADDGLAVSVSTSLGNFGVDATNTPVTLRTLTLAGGEASFDFFPGADEGAAELLARLADSAGSFMIQVVAPGDPPVAAFAFEANSLDVLFTDASEGASLSWSWDFGDDGAPDNTSTDQSPSHSYPRDDVYEVMLEVTDGLGRTSALSQFVEVASTLVAAFEAEVGSELTVIFTDASEGNPESYFWSFGDGSTSEEKSPIHTYGGPGEYLVELTIGKGEASASTAQFVAVGDIPEPEVPVAEFGYEIDGLKVIFCDASTGSPTSWSWDFGAAGAMPETSELPNPIVTFPAMGTYSVRLEVSSAFGSDDVAHFVEVPGGMDRPCPVTE